MLASVLAFAIVFAGTNAAWAQDGDFAGPDTGQDALVHAQPPGMPAASQPDARDHRAAMGPYIEVMKGDRTGGTYLFFGLGGEDYNGFRTHLESPVMLAAARKGKDTGFVSINVAKKFGDRLREARHELTLQREKLESRMDAIDDEMADVDRRLTHRELVAAAKTSGEVFVLQAQLREQKQALLAEHHALQEQADTFDDRSVTINKALKDGGGIQTAAQLYQGLIQAVLSACPNQASADPAVRQCQGDSAQALQAQLVKARAWDASVQGTDLAALEVEGLFRKGSLKDDGTGYLGENDVLSLFRIQRFGCEPDAKGSAKCEVGFIDPRGIPNSNSLAAKQSPYIWDHMQASTAADQVDKPLADSGETIDLDQLGETPPKTHSAAP